MLVVDDEEAVRHLACRMLTWSGYQALEASHGREAIATIEQHAGAIHLVLTDIKMPGMNGRELGRTWSSAGPGSRILYMSGFASEVFQGGLLEPGAPFLSKPFTQEDLVQKVRALLPAEAGLPSVRPFWRQPRPGMRGARAAHSCGTRSSTEAARALTPYSGGGSRWHKC